MSARTSLFVSEPHGNIETDARSMPSPRQRNNEMGEWQSKGKHQARPLLLAKQALKLRRPLLRFLD